MTVRPFINDFRFQPYQSNDEAWKGLDKLMQMLTICHSLNLYAAYNGNLFLFPITLSANISNLIKSDTERKRQIKDKIAKLMSYDKIIDDAGYTYMLTDNEMAVCGGCMPHAYEIHSATDVPLLLNLSMDIPTPSVKVLKNGINSKEIPSFHVSDTVTAYFQEIGLLPRFYDKNSKYRPNVSETILTDTSLFTPTKFFNKGNRLYRRRDDEDQLWCLDSAHYGNSVHLEVFSESSGKQIMVSCHDEIRPFRELTDKEKNRKISYT